MPESVVPRYLRLSSPAEIPGLVSYWHFAASSELFPAAAGEPYALQSRSGPLHVVEDATAPLGGTALDLAEGQWLNLPRRQCPALDFHGPSGCFTVVAWIRRGQKSNSECEFLAGMWNESQCGRQYGLFLNIGVWRQADQVTGHLSQGGGPTPGYKYCIDGPVGASAVPRDCWSTVAMSYDGVCGYSWLDGALDFRPGLNPYSLAGGLFNGGDGGSDFTVAAVDRGGSIGNFFTGRIAGLAVYQRALSPAEIFALSQLQIADTRSGRREPVGGRRENRVWVAERVTQPPGAINFNWPSSPPAKTHVPRLKDRKKGRPAENPNRSSPASKNAEFPPGTPGSGTSDVEISVVSFYQERKISSQQDLPPLL